MQDGEGLGFGNKISAQTVAIVRAAKEAKRVYRVDDNSPVCQLLGFVTGQEELTLILTRLGPYATLEITLTSTFDCSPPYFLGMITSGMDDKAITYLRQAAWHGTTSMHVWR